jgi:hypothetical protein
MTTLIFAFRNFANVPKNSMFCSECIHVVFFSEQRAIISLNAINFSFETETACLLRGTNRISKHNLC